MKWLPREARTVRQELFFALAEPNRRKVIEMLASKGELSAAEICSEFDVTPQDISRHLKVLRQSNLVIVEKRAQQRIYRINADTMLRLEEWAKQMTERLDALDAVVENEGKRES